MIPPPIQRGMTVLNRELFRREVSVIGVRVPTSLTAKFLKVLNKELFNQPKLRNVVNDPESNLSKVILMNLNVQSLDLDNLSSEAKDLIKKEGLGVIKHSIELKYDYWGVDDIIKAILPEGSESPSSFTQVGHIAHVNLRDEFHPWKYIIGQVILDKIPNIQTVQKESNCRFRFDFSQVYWNSRLHTEHDRLVKMFKKGECICDVFAGVGPFAVPSAKKGCIVYANDLNPTSYKYLLENISLNKVNNKIYPYNLDGRNFIKKAVKDLEKNINIVDQTKMAKPMDIVTNTSSKFRTFNHFIMNLPATAIEFLDAFKGLYKDQESLIKNPRADLPMIHCYCFSKSEAPETEIIERINSIISYSMQVDEYKIHFVRKVAPNKDMFCVSFRLSKEVAFLAKESKKSVDIITGILPHKNEISVFETSNEQKLISKRRKIEGED
ncbi:tRNA methyltransferase Trm5 [Rhizophagus clarus]|uniref:tRNA (guanine(37)-N1)-methyltransferase n=1 Tax=Rhizophagus clarus TaxID=94130 RepID=A0A8H3L0M6_9GLOM|nr:tRNA methyltransferase Trm5 [Rhizophagus clarus]